MDGATQVGKLTVSQLDEAVGELRRVADRLQAFIDGDTAAWSAEEIAGAHALLAFTGAQVNLVRAIRTAGERRAAVVSLADRR